jgi:hypothetical protein
VDEALDALPASSRRARASYETAARLETRVQAAESKPDDGPAKLELAESFLARAQEAGSEPRFSRVFYEDARRAGLEAEKLGASGWRLDELLAISSSAPR